MPKWGLSKDQRASAPWGLDPALLQPKKTITEPVHEDIYLNRLETMFVDSPPMQRLRRVRQLGTTELVYPGATHTRFSHSLGTLRAAQNLFDAALEQQSGPDPKPDLFHEWLAEGKDVFNQRVAEATVLARLGGLLHDLCHIPFGHSIEDDLGILTAHDANLDRFNALWGQIPNDVRDAIPDSLFRAIRTLVLSKRKDLADIPPEYAFVADIVGNTICADLLDYLSRDHLFTGLPARLGHRFIDGFYVTPSTDGYYPRRMAIKIRRRSRLRADVISELFKFLRYRYELSERVLVHHTKLAADAMVGKALEIWYDSIRESVARTPGHALPDTDNIDSLLESADRDQVDSAARRLVETQVLRRGDEGLLEHLRDLSEEPDAPPRLKAAGALATAVLDRKLYRLAARSDGESRAMAAEIHEKHGSFESRRRMEQRCASYVDLAHRRHVLLWIPSPMMRMKAADVLVDDGHRVQPLQAYDRATGKRGAEIYDSHQALWGVSVYVHESVVASQVDVILAWLSRELGIGWAADALPDESNQLVQIAAQVVARKRGLNHDQEMALALEPAAAGGAETFAALLQLVDIAAEAKYGEVSGATTRSRRRRAKPDQADLDLT